MAFSKEALQQSLLVYAITDRNWLPVAPNATEEQKRAAICQQVQQAIEGGASFIQMREKNLSDWDMVDEADAIRAICNKAGVPFVVNDAVAIAVASKADGAHIGQDDMDVVTARAIIGRDKILGVSVQTVEQAKRAEAQGASYLGVGAVFPTGSKDDAEQVSHETLAEICAAVSIPVVAIGGITCENIAQLQNTGIAGAAVISAIFAQENIAEAAGNLRSAASAALIR